MSVIKIIKKFIIALSIIAGWLSGSLLIGVFSAYAFAFLGTYFNKIIYIDNIYLKILLFISVGLIILFIYKVIKRNYQERTTKGLSVVSDLKKSLKDIFND